MPLRSDGEELRRRRELQGLTATEFAARSGFSLTHVSQVELGNSNAGPRYLRAASRILNCEIREITDGSMPNRSRTGGGVTAGTK
ncbi:helix-turn-helix domain-containing protein [Streptomyces corynorhini]|uniref:XRE family transcriptional regulator n=1 Tax=Streptomyces corynorhini TaxID=2282652 RepID=A0A370B493_9ACTN|nr:helix-turn-helix transcriptional regulator [Streptomyces corynorhini]RDG34673.1 XRE family transcriptional regulator [Streptomyces corynorhini]